MNKKNIVALSLTAIASVAVFASFASISKKDSFRHVDADIVAGNLVINTTTQYFEDTNRYAVDTADGNRIVYYYIGGTYKTPSEGNLWDAPASCEIGFLNPFQTVNSVTLVFTGADEAIDVFFGASVSDYSATSKGVAATSGVPVAAPEGFKEDRYITLWTNSDISLQSITINYSCSYAE